MSAPSVDRPLPVVDADGAPFWAALRDRKLMVQWCSHCDRHVFYPRGLCPHCHAELVELGGVLRLRHDPLVHGRPPPAGPAFAADVPYVVVLVDLDEGVRMLSNLLTADVESVRIGSRVVVRFEDITDDVTLPLFEPVPNTPAAG